LDRAIEAAFNQLELCGDGAERVAFAFGDSDASDARRRGCVALYRTEFWIVNQRFSGRSLATRCGQNVTVHRSRQAAAQRMPYEFFLQSIYRFDDCDSNYHDLTKSVADYYIAAKLHCLRALWMTP
jgi:hypothetical protein